MKTLCLTLLNIKLNLRLRREANQQQLALKSCSQLKMIVELQLSRQFDDSIWVPPDKDLTIMEENLNSLVDMEGYLEVKSAKMLTPNKKYWFVLSQSCLDYYENKYE